MSRQSQTATQEMPAHEEEALFDSHLSGIQVAGSEQPAHDPIEPDNPIDPDVQPVESEQAIEQTIEQDEGTGEFDPNETIQLTQQELVDLIQLGIIPNQGVDEQPVSPEQVTEAPQQPEKELPKKDDGSKDPFFQDFDLESIPPMEITDDQYEKIMSDRTEFQKFFDQRHKQSAALGAQVAVKEIVPFIQSMAVTAATNRLIEMQWRDKHPEYDSVPDEYFQAASQKVYKEVGVEKLKNMHPHDILDLAAKKLQGLTRLKGGIQRAGARVNARPDGVRSPAVSGGARHGNTTGAQPAKKQGIAAIHDFMLKQSEQD
jgi:hypothetical protein